MLWTTNLAICHAIQLYSLSWNGIMPTIHWCVIQRETSEVECSLSFGFCFAVKLCHAYPHFWIFKLWSAQIFSTLFLRLIPMDISFIFIKIERYLYGIYRLFFKPWVQQTISMIVAWQLVKKQFGTALRINCFWCIVCFTDWFVRILHTVFYRLTYVDLFISWISAISSTRLNVTWGESDF